MLQRIRCSKLSIVHMLVFVFGDSFAAVCTYEVDMILSFFQY
jgi:hypothetical protein